jgi:hypothetical protein
MTFVVIKKASGVTLAYPCLPLLTLAYPCLPLCLLVATANYCPLCCFSTLATLYGFYCILNINIKTTGGYCFKFDLKYSDKKYVKATSEVTLLYLLKV